MKVETYPNAADFIEEVGDVLRSDEVRYGLIYGIAKRVTDNPHYYGDEDPWFAIVRDNDSINALAWRTPPFLVGLAWNRGDTEEAVRLLMKAVHDRWGEIAGVLGDREVTDPFAERWCRTCGTEIQSTMAQRIYRLDTVNDVPNASGGMRLATQADKDLVSEWARAFWIEAGDQTADTETERDMTPLIEGKTIYLWEDAGKPVSIAMKARPTDHGMSVGLVYTPPEYRRRGYATSCVAGVCREILKSGYDFCTLYTDLSNPTSNSIYMKMGFRPICDSVMYGFSH